MLFATQTILEIDMLFETIAVIILLATILFPLGFKTSKAKTPAVFKIDTDTSESEYAINEHGFLEQIRSHNPQHD